MTRKETATHHAARGPIQRGVLEVYKLEIKSMKHDIFLAKSTPPHHNLNYASKSPMRSRRRFMQMRFWRDGKYSYLPLVEM